jgi:hypothetical protein
VAEAIRSVFPDALLLELNGEQQSERVIELSKTKHRPQTEQGHRVGVPSSFHKVQIAPFKLLQAAVGRVGRVRSQIIATINATLQRAKITATGLEKNARRS